jgi:glycosyltransferase involved in cell wall biosynthesis
MRIAHVVPARADPHSGVPAVIVRLAAELADRGHHVEVWLLQPWSDEGTNLYGSTLANAGVPLVIRSPSRRGGLAALAERAVEIVHLHSVFTPPNAMLARKLRVPYVLSPHGGYAPASLARSRGRKAVYTWLVERRLVRGAALRVALTDSEAGDLLAFGDLPTVVIPNGVSPAPRGIDSSAFRAELGLDPAARLLLFVGRLDIVHKGLDVLARAVAAAPGWHAVLVGSDARGGGDRLRSMARELGVDARLTITGPRRGKALHQAFAAADCFALTSRWEGLPLSLLEALAHGLPAVVSPAVDRLVGVVAAGAGWSAAPSELGELLCSVRDLDDRERARRAAAARALSARYDWATVGLRYEAAYAEILDGAPRAQGAV